MESTQIPINASVPSIVNSPTPIAKLTLTEILRRKQVQQKTGLPRSTMYALIKSGEFPKPIRLTSKRAVGWLESEVDSFIQKKITESRNRVEGVA